MSARQKDLSIDELGKIADALDALEQALVVLKKPFQKVWALSEFDEMYEILNRPAFVGLARTVREVRGAKILSESEKVL